MTDRKTLDQMTSDELDQLHAEVDRLTAELADYDQRVQTLERAEAAIARVRALADRWDNALAPDRAYARTLRAALDEPAPGPAATQTTDDQEQPHV